MLNDICQRKTLWPIFVDWVPLSQHYRTNMKRYWVNLGVTQPFWTGDFWIGNPALEALGHCKMKCKENSLRMSSWPAWQLNGDIGNQQWHFPTCKVSQRNPIFKVLSFYGTRELWAAVKKSPNLKPSSAKWVIIFWNMRKTCKTSCCLWNFEQNIWCYMTKLCL